MSEAHPQIVRRQPLGDGKPSQLTRALFVARFGGVYERSPWIAEAAYDAGLGPEADGADGLAAALARAVARGSDKQKRALIDAHPDLAGKLALAKALTAESTREQQGAGLDRLTPDELKRFTDANAAYRARFGFPFIVAVRGRTKADILAAFEARLKNDPAAERATALAEIDRIAVLRIGEIMA